MTDPIPEQVYRAAATALVRAEGVNDGYIEDTIRDEPFRAAVRAARLATAREIAAAANRPGSVPAASWRAAMDIIDELERAARAAGKDKTDGDH